MYTSEVDMLPAPEARQVRGAEDAGARRSGANSQDDAGRIYRNTNESVLHVDIVPTPYYGRNPNLVRTRGSYESLEGDDNEVNAVWPAHPTPGVNRGYQTGVLRADGTLASVHVGRRAAGLPRRPPAARRSTATSSSSSPPPTW